MCGTIKITDTKVNRPVSRKVAGIRVRDAGQIPDDFRLSGRDHAVGAAA
jgi:hypothetical protein